MTLTTYLVVSTTRSLTSISSDSKMGQVQSVAATVGVDRQVSSASNPINSLISGTYLSPTCFSFLPIMCKFWDGIHYGVIEYAFNLKLVFFLIQLEG